MVPIKETVRIIDLLQTRQPLVAPLLIPVQGRQGLVIVGVVLVHVELVVAGNGGLGEPVAPLAEEAVHGVGDRVIRVRPDGFDLVMEVFAVRKGRVVVWEGLDALDGERLDHDGGSVGQRVFLQELLESVAELDETLRVQGPGDQAVEIVSWSLGAGLGDETEHCFRG